jgi:epoxyqueuosine reductase QueG
MEIWASLPKLKTRQDNILGVTQPLGILIIKIENNLEITLNNSCGDCHSCGKSCSEVVGNAQLDGTLTMS